MGNLTYGFKLDKWQEDTLKVKGNLLLCTGRQIGKTSIMAIKAAIYMIEHKNSRIVVASLTQDQAQLIIVMALTFLEKNYPTLIGKGKYKPTQNKIHLKSYSSMIARPVGTTGNAIRGFTGDVLIVDEGSRIVPKIWTAAKPTLLSTGGEIWMCSTPNGKRTKKGKLNYFYECYLNKNKRYTTIYMDSETAINNRKISASWTIERKTKALQFLADEKASMTHLQYAQEYLAQFVDEIRQLFPDELIDAICILKRRQEPRPKEYTDFTLGTDVGRYGEGESTFEILDGTNKKAIIQVENIVTKKTALTSTSDKIIALDNNYNFGRRCIGIDSAGPGAGVFDDLRKHSREMQNKIIGLENAKRVIEKSMEKGDRLGRLMKEHLYNALIIAMERREILLLDDDNIKESLRSIQVDYNTSGKICIYGYYSHIAEGIVRALWCVENKGLNIFIA